MPTVRQEIVTFAEGQEGKPYRWAATGPDAYDCSGLVWAAEKAAGLNVSRSTSIVETHRGTEVSRDAAVPGDLVYMTGHGYVDHSGIYIGNGQMIDAPDVGQTVGVHNVPSFASFWTPPGSGPGTAADAGTPGASGQTSGSVETTGSGLLGLPTMSDVTTLVLKGIAGLGALALVVVGVRETVRSGT